MSYRLKLVYFIVLIFIIISAAVSIIIVLPTIFSNSNKQIKIMTWNISGAVGIDDKFDVNRIIDEIDEQNPDIVGLQEVNSYVEISTLAERLNMNYYYAEAGDTDEGNAILSKYKIEDVEAIDLPLIDGTRARVLLKVRLHIDNKNFYIYITHFSRYDKPKDHKNQANFVGNLISKHTTSRFILMGDLNFAPESEAYTELMDNNKVTKIDTYRYVNQDSGFTFRSNSLFKRIDYIICSYNLNPTISKVICTKASDHCAVLTQIQI